VGIDTRETCLLAMARAVQSVGMYGVAHPSAREAVANWCKLLAPLLRSHGTFTLSSDGRVALVDDVALSTTNTVIHSLLRKLYTTRAGRLELLNGFHAEDAAMIAQFLADADANHLADREHAFDTWVARNQTRHVRISQIRLREVKDGDRIVSGTRRAPPERLKPAGMPGAERHAPEDVAVWEREFKHEVDRAGRPAPVAQKVLDRIAAHLRGTTAIQPADLAEHMTQAARNPAQLAELILKSALVQHEVAQRTEEPIGADVVTCLRSVLSALQQTPEARTDEGWASVVRTLAVLEANILERQQALTGGTAADEEVIRVGVRTMQHDLEGAALKREYEQKRDALLAVERRIRSFFGIDPESPLDPGGNYPP
jgi:hypothetical protein